MEGEFLTIAETCAKLRFSRSAFYALKKRFPQICVKVGSGQGGRVLVDRRILEQVLEERRGLVVHGSNKGSRGGLR